MTAGPSFLAGLVRDHPIPGGMTPPRMPPGSAGPLLSSSGTMET